MGGWGRKLEPSFSAQGLGDLGSRLSETSAAVKGVGEDPIRFHACSSRCEGHE